jgi:two-component system phosphate regulon response regulator PhoB
MAAEILIVEDDAAIQELISVNLDRAGHGVRCAFDAEVARTLIAQSLPDLVLLDWMLPGMSGIDFLRILRADRQTQALPVILITARGEERDKILGLEIGADDYITKPFSPRELLARINVVLRRRMPHASEESIEYGGVRLDPAGKSVSSRGGQINLTPTEFRLLQFFMTHTERVYSRSQLLDNVWDADFVGDERTVDVHIRRVRVALAKVGCGNLIQTARGSGYIFSVGGVPGA